MGKDIDRNITRQLWERLKNTFTRNDVIPIENGGTGKKNLSSIVSDITNDSITQKIITNTYKSEKIESIVSGKLIINTNSIFIDLYGIYNLINHNERETIIVAVFKNTGFLKDVKCSCIYSVNNTTISMENGTITISTTIGADIETFNASTARSFISFPI